jgi:hypothetical protein
MSEGQRFSPRPHAAWVRLVVLAMVLGSCYPDALPGGTASAQGSPPPAPPPPRPATLTYTIDGEKVVASDEPWVVSEHAARTLPCRREELVIRKALIGTPHSSVPVYLVDGCGQRLVYATTPTEYMTTPPQPELILISRFARGAAKP